MSSRNKWTRVIALGAMLVLAFSMTEGFKLENKCEKNAGDELLEVKRARVFKQYGIQSTLRLMQWTGPSTAWVRYTLERLDNPRVIFHPIVRLKCYYYGSDGLPLCAPCSADLLLGSEFQTGNIWSDEFDLEIPIPSDTRGLALGLGET